MGTDAERGGYDSGTAAGRVNPIGENRAEQILSNPTIRGNLEANYFGLEWLEYCMSRRVEDETTVNDSFSVTVPAAVRQEADIKAGDKLRWSVDEEGNLSVEIVKQRYGAFSDLEPVDTGEETHAADDHDLIAGEY